MRPMIMVFLRGCVCGCGRVCGCVAGRGAPQPGLRGDAGRELGGSTGSGPSVRVSGDRTPTPHPPRTLGPPYRAGLGRVRRCFRSQECCSGVLGFAGFVFFLFFLLPFSFFCCFISHRLFKPIARLLACSLHRRRIVIFQRSCIL